MFVRDDDEQGDSFLFSFVVINMIRLKTEKVLGYKMICRTSSEIHYILIQSRSQYYCIEQALSTIVGWGWLFGFIFIFRSRLVINWRCGWWWVGCTDFPLYLMTVSIPIFHLQSHYLVCIKNHWFMVGIWPILNKEIEFIYRSYCSDCTYVYC